MKKNYLKKVLAISLSVALVFGTMAMPVFAEEPQDQEGPLKIPQEPEMKTMEEAQVRTLLEGENLSVQAQSGKEEIVEISTAADLEKLRTQPTGHYLLKGSIDLGNIDWEPIPFKGTFDGGGNTISNFRVSGKYGGLFSTIVGGKIMNLTVKDAVIDNSRASRGVASGIGSLSSSTAVNCTVENVTVSGSQCTSAIFGIAENSTVDGCHVKNSTVNGVYSEKLGFSNPWGIGGLVGESFGKTEIKNSTVENTAVVCATNKISNDNHADAIGGLVGDSYNVNISNCKVMGGSVSGYNNVGGVVGYSKFGTIEDSMSSADVTGDNNLGGFAGYFGSDQSSKLDRAEITRCWATGTVQGACEIGGFIGTTAWVKIDSSFATGDVKANNYWANTGISCAGGFVGRTNLSSLITNSYATGSVEGRKGVGGFVGYNRTGNGVDPAAIMTTDSAGLECRNSKVSECYATGDVTATDLYGNSSAGGFVGENGGTATFPVNCYATGNVTGYKNVGGFGGTFDSSGAVNCYATGTVTANTECTAGGFSGLAVRYSRGAVQFI
ncbi:MAG: GLUG motif-containing protein, partial [Anaerovorax sp.]